MITLSLPAGVLNVGCVTIIIAGASPVGLGAVLAQLKGNVWKVIVYATRSLPGPGCSKAD